MTAVREERRPPEDEITEVGAGVLRIQLPMDMPGSIRATPSLSSMA
ncbi:MAG: hypothetical protein AAFN30_12710 [Actinomycetota bacterium]